MPRKGLSNPSPVDNASVLSLLFYWWVIPFYRRGPQISDQDLNDVPKSLDARLLGKRLERAWMNELLNSLDSRREPRLIGALWKTFGPSLIILAFCRLLAELCIIGQALFIEAAINAVNETNTQLLYALGVAACCAFYILLHQSWTNLATTTGAQIRIACSCLIYRKVLKLEAVTHTLPWLRDALTSTQIELGMSEALAVHCPHLISAPIATSLVYTVLWGYLGPTCLVALPLIAFLLCILILVGVHLSKLAFQTAKLTSKRLRLLREIADGVVQIKQAVWEKVFEKKVEILREEETKFLKKESFLHVVVSLTNTEGTKLITLITVTAWVMLGNEFSVSKAYMILMTVQTLRMPLSIYFLLGIIFLFKMWNTINVMEKILLADEVSLEGREVSYEPTPLNSGVRISDVCARWGPILQQSNPLTLHNIYLSLQQGELLTIVGPAGAGKTTLLHLILGEVYPSKGRVRVHGRISYCPQNIWLTPGTVLENISSVMHTNTSLTGSSGRIKFYDRKVWLERVVQACGLDLNQLEAGWNTDVSLLSDCERAKVNLARAIYKEADIYLLDCPFSNMAGSDAAYIFSHCIRDLLRPRTVILVTDRSWCLPHSDQVLMLEKGRMEGCGTYNELVRSGLEAGKYAYSETSFYHHDARTEDHDDDDGIVTSSQFAVLHVDQPEPYLRELNQHQTTPTTTTTQNTVKSETPSTSTERPKTSISNKEEVKSELHNYLLLTANKTLLIFCFVFLFLMFSLITSWDLGYFSWSQYLKNSELDEVFHRPLAWLWITLAGLGFVTVLCYYLVHRILINNARQLHRNLVSVLLRAPITELDRNKKGIFLNYFASEMRIIDESLPATFLDSIQYLLVVISGFLLMGFASPWLLIPILIISFGVITITRLAFPVLTQLKKLQMRRMKSFEAHLQTTLDGLLTIRALGLEKSYYSQYAQIHDRQTSATHLFQSGTQALGLWLGLLASILPLVVSIGETLVTSLSIEHLGLGLYVAAGVTIITPETVTLSVETYLRLSLAHFLAEQTKIRCEKDFQLDSIQDADLPENWSKSGQVIFDKLSLVHNSSSHNFLQKLTFTIQCGEMVGIVGSVGAGKSSLIAALFRLIEPSSGRLLIDTVDISQIRLRLLRSRLGIVPSDPILFSGTLRENLDADSNHPDSELWKALDLVGLRNKVQALQGGFLAHSDQWHSHFNNYERQMFHLARAALRKVSLVLVDMARGNLNPSHEDTVIKILKKNFKHNTVILISHRLKSIMQTDRVLVLDSGKMAEYGHPYILLQNHYSHLYKMLHNAKEDSNTALIDIARESFHGSKIKIGPNKLED